MYTEPFPVTVRPVEKDGRKLFEVAAVARPNLVVVTEDVMGAINQLYKIVTLGDRPPPDL